MFGINVNVPGFEDDLEKVSSLSLERFVPLHETEAALLFEDDNILSKENLTALRSRVLAQRIG